MTELRLILQLARNDFSYFFRTKWLMAVLLSLHLSDMLVVALVYNNLMTFNYFSFFVPGVVVMGLFAAALDTGRRIWLAIREGVIQYYLSLPISIHGIVIAYLLAGGSLQWCILHRFCLLHYLFFQHKRSGARLFSCRFCSFWPWDSRASQPHLQHWHQPTESISSHISKSCKYC